MKRPLFWVCTFLSVLAIAWFWRSGGTDFEGALGEAGEDGYPWEAQKVSFCGRVCGKDFQGEQEYFLISDLSISDDPSVQNAAVSRQIISIFQRIRTTKIQCFLEAESGEAMPKIGSRVMVEGDFSLFSTHTNPGEFDYRTYNQGRSVGGRLSGAVILSAEPKRFSMAEVLYHLRIHFRDRLAAVFPQKECGVMQAMLLGDRAALDPQLKGLYQDGGILHILSISGLHVTLLGMGLFGLLRRLGLRNCAAAPIASAVLVLYGIMTGMSISSCRAIGMFLLRMLAVLWGRTYDLLTAVSVMACGMLCLIPVYGLNSGFWLSFGSILGIGLIMPIVDSAGIAILLATLPLTLLFYYEVPTYATLLNLIVIPAMAPILFFGMAAMLLPGLGILGTVDVLLLRLFENICLLARRLPFSKWNPGCPRAWQVVIYYSLLAGILWLVWKLKERRKEKTAQEPGGGIIRRMREKAAEKVARPAVRMQGPVRKVLEGIAEKLRGKVGKRFGEETLVRIPGKLTGKMLVMLRKKMERRPKKWLPGMLLPLTAVLVFCIPARNMTGVTFLDVGQGDAVLLRLSDGGVFLYDCGSTSRNKVGENVLIPYLKHEGIHSVEAVFLSHGDRDHVSGILELFALAKEEGIHVRKLYLPTRGPEEGNGLAGEGGSGLAGEGNRGLAGDGGSGLAGEGSRGLAGEGSRGLAGEGNRGLVGDGGSGLAGEGNRGLAGDGGSALTVSRLEAEEFQGILEAGMSVPGLQICILQEGDILERRGVRIMALHPPAETEGKKMAAGTQGAGVAIASKGSVMAGNEGSLCLWVRLVKGEKTMTILLTGDVEKEGEKQFLEALKSHGVEKVDVLKCAHHGSKYATSQEFLDWVDASVTVISCGRRNLYGHPATETLERLAADESIIYRTDQMGAVILELR